MNEAKLLIDYTKFYNIAVFDVICKLQKCAYFHDYLSQTTSVYNHKFHKDTKSDQKIWVVMMGE